MASIRSLDLQKAILEPSSIFDTPMEAVEADLPAEDRRRILEAWKLQVEEGSGSKSTLAAINKALETLAT